MKKVQYLLYIITFLAIGSFSEKASAQAREIQLIIGDSLTLGECSDSFSYYSIDLLIKTRFPNPEATYDTVSGAGFYNWYFNGDIETHRLSCTYQGLKFRIASIHTFEKPDGGTRTVVFGQLINTSFALWIEIDDAIQRGEVIIP